MTNEIEPIPDPQEEEAPIAELEGPFLIAQYDTDEKQNLIIKISENFGPWMLVNFIDQISTTFKFRSDSVNHWQVALFLRHLEISNRMNMEAWFQSQQAKQPQILRPGFQTPPGFNLDTK